MKKSVFLTKIENVKLDNDKIQQIEKVYNCKLPDIVKKIISFSGEAICFEGEECRLVSYKEILNFESEYEIDVISNKLIPLFDVYDNNYIVYCLATNSWAKFNIVDGAIFCKKKNFEEIF